MHRLNFFSSLSNPVLARLYLAQSVNLLGDAFTWLGLALLALELAGDSSPRVLATALTLRVGAFVLIAPLAGVLADRFDRKFLMVIAQLSRMVLVGLLPFVHQLWQVYALVLGLNIFHACFTPTYKATIPLVTDPEHHRQAIALSGTTYQILSMLGPSIAGLTAAGLGARSLFWIDAGSFGLAAILLAMLPQTLRVAPRETQTVDRVWRDVQVGTRYLWGDGALRYVLVLQLVAAIAGAQILVNTVGYIHGTLHLGDSHYGWVMAAVGSGATLATVFLGLGGDRLSPMSLAAAGAVTMTLAMIPAGFTGFWPIVFLWTIAGMGQSCVDLPMQMLIADRLPLHLQGRVYGAHFAWSHLWWAFAYPIAGWLGTQFAHRTFFYSGLLGISLWLVIQICCAPRQPLRSFMVRSMSGEHHHLHEHQAFAHSHEHEHDDHHHHAHYWLWSGQRKHRHLHYHPFVRHSHGHTHELHHHHEH